MEDSPFHHVALKKSNQQSTWWQENRERVEAEFINLLRAEAHRLSSTGAEGPPQPAIVPDVHYAALAREQASRLGISFEEHVRRLFHEAVLREEQRFSKVTLPPPIL